MILMNSKKSIWINIGIFAAIIAGYMLIIFLSSDPAPVVVSFESPGLQTLLKGLGKDEGKTISIGRLRGHPILLHFWATWCAACEADRQVLNDLARTYRESDVRMVAIASNDGEEAVKKSGKLDGAGYPQYLDEAGNLALSLGVKSLPQTLLVDSQGRVLSHFRTALTSANLEGLKKQLTALVKPREGHDLGTLPDFSLRSSQGGQVGRETLVNKVWVADFIYTSCPSLCPTLTARLHDLQEQFKSRGDFRLVSISVDPKTDTPDVLKSYQDKHHADPERWYFLTGDIKDIKELMVGGFKLGTKERPELHTSRLVLVDGMSKIRGYYDADSPQSVAKLREDLDRLLQ